ncbi:hypothetical protein C2845_PM09G19650 [Panicum miliaceum]|uniref:Cation-transporting P-type ATPase N-terminal domain-containing protein n=1 Tax=Panicum miliaceum TaxID=4540 RepID=A0A3L6RY87_PANMI|nr:hypothetical protein C2845_PM09G19650 [Panicum miliaceum]
MRKGGQDERKRRDGSASSGEDSAHQGTGLPGVGAHPERVPQLAELGVSADRGLSSEEAAARLQACSANELERHAPSSVWKLVLEQFDNTLVRVLLLAAVVSFVKAATISSGREKDRERRKAAAAAARALDPAWTIRGDPGYLWLLFETPSGFAVFSVSVRYLRQPEVNDDIVETACFLYDSDHVVEKHSKSLHNADGHLMEISGLNSSEWSAMKLATALKMICYPQERIRPPPDQDNQDQLWGGRCSQ